MNLKGWLHPLLIFLAAAILSEGIPAVLGAPFSRMVEFEQPDGTLVRLWGRGDEFCAVFETLEGYTVFFDDTQRAYCYARLTPDGTLGSTGVQIQTMAPAALGLLQHLREATAITRRKAAERRAAWEEGMEISTRWQALKQTLHFPTSSDVQYGPPSQPTLGLKVGITMLIDFDDVPATVPQSDVVGFCNGDNYSGFGNRGSVKSYFYENSNGKLTYTNVVTVYIRVPKPKTFYNDTSKDAGGQARILIQDAITAMKALPNYATEILPLFDALTTDNQNRAVAFNIFYAGGNGGVWTRGLWPHSWNLASPIELSGGGKRLYRYQITNIGSSLELGTFCHENGHMLCGYPDLYDYEYDSEGGAGFFCLMGMGSYGGGGLNPIQICAYLKLASGWGTAIELTSMSSTVGTVSVVPGTNFNVFYRYQKPGISTEYYLAECRFRTNRDLSLPSSGIAVWHVDELGDRDNQSLIPNTSHNNYELTLVQADNRWDLQHNINSGDPNDLYYRGNRATQYTNALNDFTAPSANWWDGAHSGLVFRDFSTAASTMTFVVGTNTPVPAIVQQPGNQRVIQGAQAILSVVASGLPPLAYQWAKDGLALPGATLSSYTMAAAALSNAGIYSVVVANQYGSIKSSNAVLTVVPTVPLPFALNNSNLTWTTDASFWYGQTNASHDAIAAAQSPPLQPGQSASLRTLVNGPGTISFWWRLSAAASPGTLVFDAGQQVTSISTEVWESRTVYVPSGSHEVSWTYSRDASATGDEDGAWVDEVEYAPGFTFPFIVTQPVSQSSLGGSPAIFSVTAGGTPPLTYQWLFNGTTIPGATSNRFLIVTPGAANNGCYAARVSNAYGSIVSSNAALGVVPLSAAGDNSFGQVIPSASATNAIALSAGAWHTLAVKLDGGVTAWGANWQEQCDVPSGLPAAIAVAAGGYHSLALLADGTVAGWGANFDSQASPPVGLRDVVAVSAGTWHSVALREDGTVIAWGANNWGQSSVPANLRDVMAIAAGGNHTLALRTDGTVLAWGENTDSAGFYCGQCDVPRALSDVVAVAAGDYHSAALKSDGSVVIWGDNATGQAVAPSGLGPLIAIALGGSHTLGLKADGKVIGWGANWNGQCELAPGSTNVLAIAGGGAHSMAIVGEPPEFQAPAMMAHGSTGFRTMVLTYPRNRLRVDYAENVNDNYWTPLPIPCGNGGFQIIVDSGAAGNARFYRLKSSR